MRLRGYFLFATVALTACSSHQSVPSLPVISTHASEKESSPASLLQARATESQAKAYVGLDRNSYPGDDRLALLHQHFSYISYWLNIPPGEKQNTWAGKRKLLADTGFGFLVLANGRLDAEIKRAKLSPQALGKRDAEQAVAAARQEGFPEHTILFLDQEEGGRLLAEQAAYFLSWTETIAASAFRAGAYLSGQPAPDGRGPDGKPLTITTAQDVREQIAARHLHPVVFWVSQDECPPAPGCTLAAPHLRDSGTPDAHVWQYAQSPRRPELTRGCAKTYAADNLCYAGVTADLFLDLNVADSADPSQGRERLR